MRLTGKVVLITNVGQYMGPACAEEFAKEGAILALHERTEARAQAVLELARAYGREATVVTGDLTVSGEANRVVRAVAERHGRTSRCAAPSEASDPQLAIGGWTPSPRKERKASSSITAGTVRVA